MTPTRSLVLLCLVPVLLGVGVVWDRSLLPAMVAVDLAIAAVAALDAFLARGRLVDVARTAPPVLSIGRENPVTLTLTSRARRRLVVEAWDDPFPGSEPSGLPLQASLDPGERRRFTYRLSPSVRGAFSLSRLAVRYASPLGFFARRYVVSAPAEVKVYPDVQAVRTFELLARRNRDAEAGRRNRQRGGENEFERLREYRTGDEYRAIDWKATARRRRLIARDYQLEQNQAILLALDAGRLMTTEVPGAPGGPAISLFDHALNAALMLTHVAARGGDQVGLVAFSDAVRTFVPPVGGRRASREVLEAAYAVHPEHVETRFSSLAELVAARVKKRTLVVLFTEVIDEVAERALREATRALLPRHLPLCVLLRDDAVESLAAPDGPPRSDDDLYARAAAAELLSAREKLIRDLRQRGALVLDVSPRDLTPRLVNDYLDVKARALL